MSRPTPPVFVKPIAPGQWLVVMGSAPVRTFPTRDEAMEEARRHSPRTAPDLEREEETR